MTPQRTAAVLHRRRAKVLALPLALLSLGLGGMLVPATTSSAAAEPTPRAAGTDTTAPAVRQIEVSRRSVDTHRHARTVAVTMHVVDPGVPGDDASGVVPFVVRMAIRPWIPAQTATLTSGTAYDGVWRARFTVPRWAGHRFLTPDVRAVDAAGNRTRSYARDQRVEVHSGTDTTAPRVAFLHGVPKTFHAQQGTRTYPFTLRLTDRPTGVASARVDLLMPKKKDADGETRIYTSSTPLRYGGTARDGRWRGQVTIDPGWVRDLTLDWRVTVVDQRGNVRVSWRSSLEHHGSRAHTMIDAG